MVLYDPHQRCVFECELEHIVVGFLSLKERIEVVREREGRVPEIFFEAIGVFGCYLQEANTE